MSGSKKRSVVVDLRTRPPEFDSTNQNSLRAQRRTHRYVLRQSYYLQMPHPQRRPHLAPGECVFVAKSLIQWRNVTHNVSRDLPTRFVPHHDRVRLPVRSSLALPIFPRETEEPYLNRRCAVCDGRGRREEPLPFGGPHRTFHPKTRMHNTRLISDDPARPVFVHSLDDCQRFGFRQDPPSFTCRPISRIQPDSSAQASGVNVFMLSAWISLPIHSSTL